MAQESQGIPSLHTPLYSWHLAAKARMVDFAGWSMPVYYTSIVDEHLATRRAAGLFDISHMGRLRFDGPAAAAFLDRLLTRRVVGMEVGQIRYSLMTHERGGILDDVLVYRLAQTPTRDYHLLVVNAGNRTKIVNWIQSRLPESGVDFEDVSAETAMIAAQGPQAIPTLLSHDKRLVEMPPDRPFDYYTGRHGEVCGHPAIISRTGYTGEDGCEVIVPAERAQEVWEAMLQAVTPSGGVPVGLGARDTLRLEAAMPLYGHELTEEVNPYQAGLAFAVNLKDRDFIGRDALAAAKSKAASSVRVGLEMEGKRIPREHYPVCQGTDVVGEVTSGTFSPTLERPIAMAYVRPEFTQPGTGLAIDIRGRKEPARVVALPFYSRSKR